MEVKNLDNTWRQVASGTNADFTKYDNYSVRAVKSFAATSTTGVRVRFTAAVSSGLVWLNEVEVWGAAASTSTQRFDAWGNVLASTGSIPTYGYTGREPDASGLTYMRARYYSPSYGRFISRDPIGLRGGVASYSYANGNPVSFNDPSGLVAAAPTVGGSVTNYAGQVQNYFNQPLVQDTLSTISTGAKAAVGNIFSDTVNGAASWGEQFTHSAPGSFGRVDGLVSVSNPVQQQVANDLRGAVGTALSFAPILSGGKSFAGTIADGGGAGVGGIDDALTNGMKYADRVRARSVQDPVSHNFPYSFDDAILATQPVPKKNGYNMFQKLGDMNGKAGVFEIGVTKDRVIDHRFFRPTK